MRFRQFLRAAIVLVAPLYDQPQQLAALPSTEAATQPAQLAQGRRGIIAGVFHGSPFSENAGCHVHGSGNSVENAA